MEDTTGTQTIEWLYRDHLQVDDEWAVRTPHGFRWWADRHAQQVEVIGEQTGTLSLASLVRVHDEIAGCINPMIGVAAALQLAEARAAADWPRGLRAEEAVSWDPDHGRRGTPDELVNVVPSVVVPSGQSPSLRKRPPRNAVLSRSRNQPKRGDTPCPRDKRDGARLSSVRLRLRQLHLPMNAPWTPERFSRTKSPIGRLLETQEGE